MRIAVVGGTGLVGRSTIEAVHRAGHEAVVVARSRGVDVTTGDGLVDALAGAEAVIDVTNSTATDAAATRQFFGAAAEQLMAAGQRVGVRHHVVLSIVGVDRVEGNAHYAGKRRQEELVRNGPVPWTIVRATQFHEFAGMVAGWTRQGDTAVVPPLLVQPVAVPDVARVLAEVAAGRPYHRALDVAGPGPQDLVDMARRTFAARGDAVRLVPSWRDGPFDVEMAGEVLLPGPDARLEATTFEAWLAEQGGGS